LTSRLPLILSLYRGGVTLLEPVALGLLAWRWRKGKEDGARIGERRGLASRPRPRDRLAWLHGASVGETLALLPLVERLTRRGVKVLVTSGTRTSADLLARRLPPGSLHQFFPLDVPRYLRRFLDHWRPDLAVFVESELWPNLIAAASARDVRLALVSARMTQASADRWARWPASARAVMGAFDLVLPQDAATEARLAKLGASPGPRLNLKRVGEPLPAEPAELARLRAAIGDRKVVLAASTHPGEEPLIAEADAAPTPSERNPRKGSPPSGSSILTTSAPQSAIMPPPAGPAAQMASSTIFTPSSAPDMGSPHRQRGMTSFANNSIERLTVA